MWNCFRGVLTSVRLCMKHQCKISADFIWILGCSHIYDNSSIVWIISDPQIGLHFGLRQNGTTGNKPVIEKIFENNEEVSLTLQDYTNLVYIVNMTRIVPGFPPFAEIDLIDDDIREKLLFNFTHHYHDVTEEDEKCK